MSATETISKTDSYEVKRIKRLDADLQRHVQMLDDLNEGRVPPRRVVGTGYKNARKQAVEYLEKSIAELTYSKNWYNKTKGVSKFKIGDRVSYDGTATYFGIVSHSTLGIYRVYWEDGDGNDVNYLESELKAA